jgi:hypothetical protein
VWKGHYELNFFNVITSPLFLKKDKGCSDLGNPTVSLSALPGWIYSYAGRCVF